MVECISSLTVTIRGTASSISSLWALCWPGWLYSWRLLSRRVPISAGALCSLSGLMLQPRGRLGRVGEVRHGDHRELRCSSSVMRSNTGLQPVAVAHGHQAGFALGELVDGVLLAVLRVG